MNRLRELREEKNKTLREVASDVSMSFSNLGSLERGEAQLKEDTTKLFASYYGVSADYLLGNSDIRTPLNLQQFGAGVQSELVKECHQLTDAQAQQILDLIKSFKK